MKHQVKISVDVDVDVDVDLCGDTACVNVSFVLFRFSRRYKVKVPQFTKFGDYIPIDDQEKIAAKMAIKLFKEEINEE